MVHLLNSTKELNSPTPSLIKKEQKSPKGANPEHRDNMKIILKVCSVTCSPVGMYSTHWTSCELFFNICSHCPLFQNRFYLDEFIFFLCARSNRLKGHLESFLQFFSEDFT